MTSYKYKQSAFFCFLRTFFAFFRNLIFKCAQNVHFLCTFLENLPKMAIFRQNFGQKSPKTEILAKIVIPENFVPQCVFKNDRPREIQTEKLKSVKKSSPYTRGFFVTKNALFTCYQSKKYQNVCTKVQKSCNFRKMPKTGPKSGFFAHFSSKIRLFS